jgi:predicted transcriptional regulator
VTDLTAPSARAAARAMVLPLALAQFIASYAATNQHGHGLAEAAAGLHGLTEGDRSAPGAH